MKPAPYILAPSRWTRLIALFVRLLLPKTQLAAFLAFLLAYRSDHSHPTPEQMRVFFLDVAGEFLRSQGWMLIQTNFGARWTKCFTGKYRESHFLHAALSRELGILPGEQGYKIPEPVIPEKLFIGEAEPV